MLKIQELREIIRLVDQSSISEFNYEKDEFLDKYIKDYFYKECILSMVSKRFLEYMEDYDE